MKLWVVVLLVLGTYSVVLSHANGGDSSLEDSGDQALTDEAIEKMRVKELRKFLKARNLGCPGCIEKRHLVAAVKEHRNVPESPAEDASFAGAWASIAFSDCMSALNTPGSCKKLSKATKEVLGKFGGNLASTLGKSPDKLKTTSLTEPFKGAGKRKLGQTINWIKGQAKDVTQEELQRQLQSNLMQWAVNTLMEKKESMFDFSGMDMQEILQQFGKQNQQGNKAEL